MGKLPHGKGEDILPLGVALVQDFKTPTMKPLTLVICLLAASSCFAMEDTPENRAKEAARYLEATPPEAMLADMTANVAKTIPEAQRPQFVKMMTEYFDIAAFKEATKKSAIKVFTADELKALADFYGSPEGQSSVKKMGLYMADMMPVVQAQIMNSMKKAKEAQDASEKKEPAPVVTP
jgi:hypothetical protein